jgi:hypothetical protein
MIRRKTAAKLAAAMVMLAVAIQPVAADEALEDGGGCVGQTLLSENSTDHCCANTSCYVFWNDFATAITQTYTNMCVRVIHTGTSGCCSWG